MPIHKQFMIQGQMSISISNQGIFHLKETKDLLAVKPYNSASTISALAKLHNFSDSMIPLKILVIDQNFIAMFGITLLNFLILSTQMDHLLLSVRNKELTYFPIFM